MARGSRPPPPRAPRPGGLLPRAWEELGRLDRRGLLLATLGLTALGELGNLFLRYGLGWSSARDTAFLAPWTGGLRIHHCYVGALLLLLALALRARPSRHGLLVLGGALLLSGLLHHSLVLWLLEGAPRFELFYPGWPR